MNTTGCEDAADEEVDGAMVDALTVNAIPKYAKFQS